MLSNLMIFSLHNKRLRTNDWLEEHAVQLGALSILVFFILVPNRSSHYSYLLLAIAVLGVQRDCLALSWRRFLLVGIPLVLFPILMRRYFPPIWNDVVYWQMGAKTHLFDFDAIFSAVPGNNGWMFRVIQTPWLTAYFRWIYANGFTLPVLIPIRGLDH